MKRVLQAVGVILGVVLIGAVAFFLWASSGTLPEEQLAQIKTYPASPASADRDTFTVMTYNIGYLSGMTNNEPVVRTDSLLRANMDQAVHLIRRADPDFIGFQEIDFGAARSAWVHQLDTLATHLGYANAALAVNWDERYLPFPYWPPKVHFGRVLSGQAILSQYPIRQQVREVLPRPPQPFFRDAFYLDRLAQVAVVDIGGWPLIIINVHLEAFDTETREKQARRVNTLYRRLARQGFPILLLGDFNSVRPSALPTLPLDAQREFANDETMELLLKGTSLMPAFSEGAQITGKSISTYPADDPTRKIDYIYYRPRRIVPINSEIWCGTAPQFAGERASQAASRSERKTKSQAAPLSDHCAVTMTFLLPRPKEKLPEKRIPDEKLPSLDSLMAAP